MQTTATPIVTLKRRKICSLRVQLHHLRGRVLKTTQRDLKIDIALATLRKKVPGPLYELVKIVSPQMQDGFPFALVKMSQSGNRLRRKRQWDRDRLLSVVPASRRCEYAHIVYVYGLCDGNATAAVLAYQARFPNRRIPSAQLFSRAYWQISHSGQPPSACVKKENAQRQEQAQVVVVLRHGLQGHLILTPLDYYLWGDMKRMVYATEVDTREQLRNRIIAASELIKNSPRTIQSATNGLLRRAENCIAAQGGYFEQRQN
ncbi:hypothetical protein ANN_19125 [Periplaneta americana]|uniref:DUF4817 domain-containing protein n=1 Tax=Periplaneta americana TaxID=6978 RepID=A0ABQ8S9X4_PERAM|nr:hypothetical protein ANN_19125 [Periplaneta americana]